jgi:hypothetical protein
MLIESSNLLMMDTRARDQGEWMAAARRLADTAGGALKAAESRGGNAGQEVAPFARSEAVGAMLKRGPFNAWLRSPDLGDRLQRVGEYIRFNTSLPRR